MVTHDPRGLGESTRSDLNDPQIQAEDLHALIAELGGPVDVFGSNGGAVAGLALVTAHPEDVRMMVAHEPPLLGVLPDAEARATTATPAVSGLRPRRRGQRASDCPLWRSFIAWSSRRATEGDQPVA